MKIAIYGAKPEREAIGEIISHIPEGAKDVIIQAPLRNAVDRRPCQQPNWLIYTMAVDDKLFATLIQKAPNAPMEVIYA